ncbi:hypothetical protein [Halorientalis salina]|uniref:hypothetical protein n=1 Tax=Halorientalis salina TaxID=2932266 RepID=UPI0010AD1B06|nr:hypothetical protein [Halorientalis salina]
MEIRVELDGDVVEELTEEAQLQGFDDRESYLRWIVAHRPMSDLATTQAPAVASRVSELEERVTLLERQLDLDEPTNPDSDLGTADSGANLDEGSGGGVDLDSGSEPSLGDDAGSDTVDLDAPEDDPEPEPEEDAAEDDDIAEAIGDVSLDDEE